jgi:uncharacterized membrane protein
MPAVMIRELDALASIAVHTTTDDQRACLLAQADMILRASEESVPEASDRSAVRRRHDIVTSAVQATSRGVLDPRADTTEDLPPASSS